jgi:hypothetical protein
MRHEWTKREIEQLVDMTLDGAGPHAIAARLRRASKTIRAMQIELELIDVSSMSKRWSEDERIVLREKYENTPSIDIAHELGRALSSVHNHAAKLGLKKSKQTIAAMSRAKLERGDHASIYHRYPKGHVPANKGLRRPGWSPGRMADTQFRKGNKPHTWKPIGTERLTKEGYLQRKIADTGNTVDDFVEVHRLLWEQAKGPIPPGHVVVFKDRDRTHVQLDNLELITRADLVRRNTFHNLPEDLKQVIRINASLNRRIRRIQREKQDVRSEEPSLRDARSA